MRDYSGSKNPFFGHKHTEKSKLEQAKFRKGKTNEEIFGIEKAEEIKEKRSRIRVPCSPEKAKKIGDAQRGELNHMFGKSSWNKGLKATPEAIENQSKSHIGQVSWCKGLHPEHMQGKNNHQFGKPHTTGKYYLYISPFQGEVKLNHSYEYRYAIYLDFNNTKWYYQFKTFELIINEKLVTYTPDFYLPSQDKYIEVKGRFYKDAEEKFEIFKQQYPDIKIELLFAKDLRNLGINIRTKDPTKFIRIK